MRNVANRVQQRQRTTTVFSSYSVVQLAHIVVAVIIFTLLLASDTTNLASAAQGGGGVLPAPAQEELSKSSSLPPSTNDDDGSLVRKSAEAAHGSNSYPNNRMEGGGGRRQSDHQEDKERGGEAAQFMQIAEHMFRSGVEAMYIDGNITQAAELFFASANEGFPPAATMMAVLHEFGIGVVRSPAKAILYHMIATEGDGNSAESHVALSYRFQHGIGVVKSCTTAVKHAKAAADIFAKTYNAKLRPEVPHVKLSEIERGVEGKKTHLRSQEQSVLTFMSEKGDNMATMKLGVNYMYGQNGVQQNGAEAVHHFMMAVEKGEAAAHGALGQIYYHGMDPPTDPDMNDPAAIATQDLAMPTSLHHLGDNNAPTSTKGALPSTATAEEESSRSSPHATMHEDKGAGVEGISANIEGEGAPPIQEIKDDDDDTAAVATSPSSSSFSSTTAGIKRDRAAAFQHFKEGAKHHHPISLNGLGYIYGKGDAEIGVERDFEKAAGYFKESADRGNAEGMYNLALLHYYGKGTKQDVAKASQLFVRAAAAGSVLAHWKLGELNMRGLGGIPRSCEAALKNYKHVIDKGVWMRREVAVRKAFDDGDYLSALIDNLFLAELGIVPTARDNAAHMIQRDIGVDELPLYYPPPRKQQRKEQQQPGGDHHHEEASPSSFLSQEESRLRILFDLTMRSATEGDVDAQVRMGDLYYSGLGTEGGRADMQKAQLYYRSAATKFSPEALYNLGVMHMFHMIKPEEEQEEEMMAEEATAMDTIVSERGHNRGRHHRRPRPGSNSRSSREEQEPSVTSMMLDRQQQKRQQRRRFNGGDYHLAKRYFDTAIESSTESYYPCTAALMLLNFLWWLNYNGPLVGGSRISKATEDPAHPPTSTLWGLLSRAVSQFPTMPEVFGMKLDDAILVASLVLIVILLLLRHHAFAHRPL